MVPDIIRGAILGFAARAPKNSGALCVQFDSSSMGLPYLLARAFQRVRLFLFLFNSFAGNSAILCLLMTTIYMCLATAQYCAY